LKKSHEGNAYRAVYVAKLKDKIYVLHCSQKKSKSGIATPQKDIDLIEKRLKLPRTEIEIL
jgi:phage-related protein